MPSSTTTKFVHFVTLLYAMIRYHPTDCFVVTTYNKKYLNLTHAFSIYLKLKLLKPGILQIKRFITYMWIIENTLMDFS